MNRSIRHSLGVMLLAALMLLGTSAIALGQSDQSDASDLSDPSDTGSRLQYTTRYRLDARYMNADESSQVAIMTAEAEVFGSYGDKIDFGLQIPIATIMEGRGRDMHFGSTYAILKGKIKQPTLKLGQFVIPFGNLSDYETHTRVFQTLYANSLGIRIDPGLEVEGYLGDAEYQLAITNGNGPWRSDIDGNKVIAARVSKRFEIGENDLKVGLSALKGRLPVFSLMDDPLMDGRGARLVNIETSEVVGQGDRSGFADKTRFGLDIEYYRGIDLIRAEAVFGSDNGRSVDGQWLQYEHPLSYETSLVGMVERWSQSTGSFVGWGLGVEHKLQENRTLRVAYQNRRIHESLDGMSMKMDMPMLTAQYLVEF